ncbi:MAG: hypothetical protein HC821_02985 [Lewinella sp.]|nr:hypothetical protein [Lewinella sp.]
MSKTNLRMVVEKKQLQVEMHLFLDDLTQALAAAGAPDLRLGTEREVAGASQFLDRYLRRHFQIQWNGRTLDIELVGYEPSDDLQALWVYYVAEVTEAPSQLRVMNRMLTDLFADQRNLTKLLGGPRELTLLTSRDQPTAQHQF